MKKTDIKFAKQDPEALKQAFNLENNFLKQE